MNKKLITIGLLLLAMVTPVHAAAYDILSMSKVVAKEYVANISAKDAGKVYKCTMKKVQKVLGYASQSAIQLSSDGHRDAYVVGMVSAFAADCVTEVVLGPAVPVSSMVEFSAFVVNIIGQEDAHYLKASFTIELNNDDAVEEVHRHMSQIRDAIILLTSNKTFEDLHDLQGKKQFKAELIREINSLLQSAKVQQLYFTDFVLQ